MRVVLTACAIDLELRQIHGFDEVRTLTPNEAALLTYLAAHPGRPLSKETLLTEVWGYKKGVDSSTVFTTIRRLRTKIEADPAKPDHLITVRGLGYRFVTAKVSTSTLLGRSADLARVEQLLEAARLVTIVGPGGMGKTRLAREALARHNGPGWFCDLSETHDATEVTAAVTAATAGPDQVLDQSNALLVLDNLEQVLEGAASVVRRWLSFLPDLKILATSREALELEPERTLVLGPLDAGDAAELFRRRALAVDPGFEASAPVIDAIVERLDGIPLAVELAAGRIRVLAPDDVLKRLDDQLAILRGRRRDRPARHATLEAAVDGSWDLLSAEERVAFARCAVFHGGFDLPAAETVLGPDALDLVEGLVARSLLWVDRNGRAPRFRIYEVLRAYARAQLAGNGDADDARLAHAHHYARARWARVPLAEVDNCIAAARHAVGDDAGHLVLALQFHIRERYKLDDILPLVARAVEGVTDMTLKARILRSRGDLFVMAGRGDDGAPDLDAAFELAQTHGLVRTEALVWAARGSKARLEGDSLGAIALFERALELLDPKKDEAAVGAMYGRMGLTWGDLGELDKAMHWLGRALEVHVATGNALNEANVRTNRVQLRSTGTNVELEELARALRLAEGVGSFRLMAHALFQTARLLTDRGEHDEARTALERSRRFYALVGKEPKWLEALS